MAFASNVGGLFGTPTYNNFMSGRGSGASHEEDCQETTSETESTHSGSGCGGRQDDLLVTTSPGGPASAATVPPISVSCAGPGGGALQPTKIPDFALPMQPKLLKQINSFATKEELLQFVASCHFLLDPINLVTCVYRLARMYCGIRHPEARHSWRLELSYSASFQLLLRTIQNQMLGAQMGMGPDIKGLDARCVSNLVWALVKLDLASEVDCMGTEVILSISPLVTKLLPQSSPQGLANLLWAYAKLPAPPMGVMVVITTQMTEMLNRDASGSLFDAQALSNSVWALAHTRSKACDLDLLAGKPGSVVAFLSAVAKSAIAMLRTLHGKHDSHLQSFMNNVESRFSCQALVNIVWSFASLLGEECTAHHFIKTLFANSKKEAILRLRATASALQTQQAWVYHVPGGFNEQALSNIVYAYEKAGLLDKELLAWVFNVASLRLDRRDAPPSFKPQELCTLLRAAHLPIAEPFGFLTKLVRVLQAMPWIIRNWSPAEVNELQRALALMSAYMPTGGGGGGGVGVGAGAGGVPAASSMAPNVNVSSGMQLPLASVLAAANAAQQQQQGNHRQQQNNYQQQMSHQQQQHALSQLALLPGFAGLSLNLEGPSAAQQQAQVQQAAAAAAAAAAVASLASDQQMLLQQLAAAQQQQQQQGGMHVGSPGSGPLPNINVNVSNAMQTLQALQMLQMQQQQAVGQGAGPSTSSPIHMNMNMGMHMGMGMGQWM